MIVQLNFMILQILLIKENQQKFKLMNKNLNIQINKHKKTWIWKEILMNQMMMIQMMMMMMMMVNRKNKKV